MDPKEMHASVQKRAEEMLVNAHTLAETASIDLGRDVARHEAERKCIWFTMAKISMVLEAMLEKFPE